MNKVINYSQKFIHMFLLIICFICVRDMNIFPEAIYESEQPKSVVTKQSGINMSINLTLYMLSSKISTIFLNHREINVCINPKKSQLIINIYDTVIKTLKWQFPAGSYDKPWLKQMSIAHDVSNTYGGFLFSKRAGELLTNET